MRQRNEKATCETCPYYCSWENPNQYIDGSCRKRSPELVAKDLEDACAAYPETRKKEWCGEHPDFWEEVT
jgi:hypothetical protein